MRDRHARASKGAKEEQRPVDARHSVVYLERFGLCMDAQVDRQVVVEPGGGAQNVRIYRHYKKKARVLARGALILAQRVR